MLSFTGLRLNVCILYFLPSTSSIKNGNKNVKAYLIYLDIHRNVILHLDASQRMHFVLCSVNKKYKKTVIKNWKAFVNYLDIHSHVVLCLVMRLRLFPVL